MWYVFCYCAFSCPCSTKTSCVLCSFDWLFRLFSLCFNYFLVILPNFHFTIISFQFPSYFFDFYVCKPLVYPLIFAQLQEKILFHPIFSSFFVYIFLLWVQSLSNTQSCLLPFLISFFFVWSVAWWRPFETGSGATWMPGAIPSQLVVPVPLTPLFLFLHLTFHAFDLTFIWSCVLWFPPTSVFIETPSLKRLPPKAEESFYRWDRPSPAGRQPGILKS